jgi:hypothetical protein
MGILVSRETLRQLLIDDRLSHQRIRSWKWSPHPDFKEKAERVLALYGAKPEDGVVVCFDEARIITPDMQQTSPPPIYLMRDAWARRSGGIVTPRRRKRVFVVLRGSLVHCVQGLRAVVIR